MEVNEMGSDLIEGMKKAGFHTDADVAARIRDLVELMDDIPLEDEAFRAAVINKFSKSDEDIEAIEDVVVRLSDIEALDSGCLNDLALEILGADATAREIYNGLDQLFTDAQRATYFDTSDLHNAYDDSLGTVEIGGITHDAARVLRDTDPIAFELGFQDFCDAHLDEMHPCLIVEVNGFYNWE